MTDRKITIEKRSVTDSSRSVGSVHTHVAYRGRYVHRQRYGFIYTRDWTLFIVHLKTKKFLRFSIISNLSVYT